MIGADDRLGLTQRERRLVIKFALRELEPAR